MTSTKNRAAIEFIKKYGIWILVFLTIVLAVAYAYLVNQTVLNIVKRENIEKSITELSSKISHLESQYIAKTQSINLELAYEMGFTEAKEKVFVSRSPLAETVSLNKVE